MKQLYVKKWNVSSILDEHENYRLNVFSTNIKYLKKNNYREMYDIKLLEWLKNYSDLIQDEKQNFSNKENIEAYMFKIELPTSVFVGSKNDVRLNKEKLRKHICKIKNILFPFDTNYVLYIKKNTSELKYYGYLMILDRTYYDEPKKIILSKVARENYYIDKHTKEKCHGNSKNAELKIARGQTYYETKEIRVSNKYRTNITNVPGNGQLFKKYISIVKRQIKRVFATILKVSIKQFNLLNMLHKKTTIKRVRTKNNKYRTIHIKDPFYIRRVTAYNQVINTLELINIKKFNNMHHTELEQKEVINNIKDELEYLYELYKSNIKYFEKKCRQLIYKIEYYYC